jgi:hypothetical protein
LRPRAGAPPWIVLEVAIKEKPASAFGPSFQEMRRGGPPGDLERELGNGIRSRERSRSYGAARIAA